MPEGSDRLACFEHVVVLMLENRSFDNLLGYLHPADHEPPFEGVEGRGLSNPIPPNAPRPDPPRGGDTETEVVVKRGDDYHAPYPDPGEPLPNVDRQLFGPGRERDEPARMLGFVDDYIDNFPRAGTPDGAPPSYDQYRVIMDCFPPEHVPVLATLAREFAVFDRWHCAVPSQTWCNRAFWHAATSYGRVLNGPSLKWFCGSNAPNLFTRLADRFGDPRDGTAEHPAWRIYSPRDNFVSLTMFLHLRALYRYDDAEHVAEFERFFDDCAKGRLPRYTFLEPQFLLRHDDQHPAAFDSLAFGRTHAGSVLLGEHLIQRVYDAVRQSRSEHGNNWENTLLVITHDEHGGCYDHVPPPRAVPPRPGAGQCGFTFDRLGVRVPMVMVSAHIAAGTIASDVHDHTSLLKTLEAKWGLRTLTARDQAARSFAHVLDPSTTRAPDTWPTPRAAPLPDDDDEPHRREPLHGMQRDLLQAAGLLHGVPREQIDGLRTLGAAHDHLGARVGSRRKRGPWLVFLHLAWRAIVDLFSGRARSR